jgi:hypothetical protein
MITISNSQRDSVVKYLELLDKTLQGEDTVTFNTRRLARKLAKALKAKKPVSASDLNRYKKPTEKVIIQQSLPFLTEKTDGDRQ